MSLVRYRPVPSDRMAALWTFAQITDAVILDCGPMGTVSFEKRKIGNMGVDTSNIYATHLTDHEIVMGDVARIEAAISSADSEKKSPLIIVIPSVILTTTGADIRGVCNYMQDEINAQLLVYAVKGSDGDFTRGLKSSYSILVEELCEISETEAGTCNILGVSAASPSSKKDAAEVCSLLEKAYGLRTILRLGAPCEYEDFKKASSASINIVLRAEALDAARYMEKEFGIPYVYKVPYGFRKTAEFIAEVGRVTGSEPDSGLMNEIQALSSRYENSQAGKAVTVMGDYDLTSGIMQFASELGITDVCGICEHDLSWIDDPDPAVTHYDREKDWIGQVSGLHGNLIIGDERVGYIAPKDNDLLIASNGELAPDKSYTGPFMGISGAKEIIIRLSSNAHIKEAL